MKDICNVCGEFDNIFAISLDGKKKYCSSCFNDAVIEANTVYPTKDAKPLQEKTIEELKRRGWLKVKE